MHSQEPEAIRQLWGLGGTARRGPSPRFDVQAVASAAVDLADEKGFDAVTLATTAQRLGLTTTALYRYVDAKETLIELMIDDALGPPPDTRAVTVLVAHLWVRHEAHPWLATIRLTRAPRAPHALAWMNLLVGLLREDGDSDPLGTALAVDTLVRGYAALAQVTGELSPELAEEIARRHPNLVGGAQRDRPLVEELNAIVARVISTRSSGFDA